MRATDALEIWMLFLDVKANKKNLKKTFPTFLAAQVEELSTLGSLECRTAPLEIKKNAAASGHAEEGRQFKGNR